MKFAQAALWIAFLFLGGRQIQSSRESPASLAKAGERFQTTLSKVPKPTLPKLFPEKSTLPSQAPARPQPVAALRRSTPRVWPTEARIALPLDLPIRKYSSERSSNKRASWTYQSRHFTFESDAPLRDHVVREFTALFELTHLYCSQLPFELRRLQTKGNDELKVQLIENYSEYLREGGAPGSGGIYLTDPDLILVPFEGLGLEKKRDSYALDLGRSNQTLMHETTHMMMHGPLLKDGWFVEGAAEYVATIPMRKNSLLLEDHRQSIVSYVTGYGFRNGGGHNLGAKIELAPLQTLMECDYRQFQQIKNGYPYSLLVFHYFAHSDGERDAARLKNYAQALNSGANTQTARKKLLAGRDYLTLQNEIAASWQKQGIQLTFQK